MLEARPATLFDRRLREAAFPAELRAFASELGQRVADRPRLLEVGSGPVSILAAGADEGLFTIVAVDPLALAYRNLLRLQGLDYPVAPIRGSGEKLLGRFERASFDAVYSSNALDHTRSPRACIEQMTAVLRPDGWLVLEGFLREGSNGNWLGLHQHDLFPADGALAHVDRAGRRTDLTSGLPLAHVSERVCQFRDRGIEAFGYEVPPDMPPDAPWDWRRRDWYTMVFRRTQD